MNDIYKKQVEKIVEGVKIHSLTSFEVLGIDEIVKHQRAYSNYNGDIKAFGSHLNIDELEQKQNLINALTNRIYGIFYCGIPKDYRIEIVPPKDERYHFMDKLSLANSTKDGLDYNWIIYNVDTSGNAYVKKNDELRWLKPKGYQFQNPDQKQVAINTKVNIVKSREAKNIQPVFYHVFSEEIFPQEAELARFYWHINPNGADLLIQQITQVLNDYRIPFQFKCLNHPDLYVRTDSAVLYCSKKYVAVVSQLLKSILTVIEPFLRDDVPLFTKKLYKGLSYAEDPGKGMSFGMSRCSIIAESLVNSFLKDNNKTKTLQTVIQTLESKGIFLERLHLNNHTVLTPNFPSYE